MAEGPTSVTAHFAGLPDPRCVAALPGALARSAPGQHGDPIDPRRRVSAIEPWDVAAD